jgi:hypothetical protein
MKYRSIKLPNVEVSVFDEGPLKGHVDEIFVTLPDGKCVFHLEKMSSNHFWMAAYSPDGDKQLMMRVSAATEMNFITETDEPEDDDSDPETGAPKCPS